METELSLRKTFCIQHALRIMRLVPQWQRSYIKYHYRCCDRTPWQYLNSYYHKRE
jgi:hypothetical protein